MKSVEKQELRPGKATKQLLKEPEGSRGAGLAGRAWGPGLGAVGSPRGRPWALEMTLLLAA